MPEMSGDDDAADHGRSSSTEIFHSALTVTSSKKVRPDGALATWASFWWIARIVSVSEGYNALRR
jgi:hypothetical protein